MSITYSEYVFVALGIWHAMRINHVVLCGLYGCTLFFTLSQRHDFRGGKKILHKMYCLIFYTYFFWIISHSKKNWARYKKIYIRLHVKYALFCRTWVKLEFSGQIFWKYSKIKFHKNPSNWNRVPCGGTDGHTDSAKLIVSFHSFGNAPKNGTGSWDVMPTNFWPLFQMKLLPLLWGQIPLSRVWVLTAALPSEVSVSGHSASRSGSRFS